MIKLHEGIGASISPTLLNDYQQRLEYLCGLAQKANSDAVIVGTADLAKALSEIYRLWDRLMKAEK